MTAPVADSTGPKAAPPRRWRSRTAVFLLQGIAGLLLLLGILNFYSRAAAVMPYTGVEWARSPDGVVAVRVESGSPADAAGLRSGDVLLVLDNNRQVSARQASDAPWLLIPEENLALSVARMGRVLEMELTPVWRESRSSLHAYTAVVGFFFLFSGVLVLYRLGPEQVAIRYFLMVLAAFALFAFSQTGEGGLLDFVFMGLDLIGRLLFPALLLYQAVTFPAAESIRRWGAAIIFGPVVAAVAAMLWLGPLGGAMGLANSVAVLELTDATELLGTALYFIMAFVVLAIRSAWARVPSARRQLRWTAWGVGMGALPFVALYLIPQGLSVETPVAADLSVLPLMIVPLAFSTAILKYRLADLGLFVKHGATGAILTLFSLALYLLVNLVLRSTLGLPGIDRRVFTVLAAVVVFLLYPHLRRVVGEGVDRAFYLGHYNYRRTLEQFASELNSERELLPLMVKFHERIQHTLPVKRSVLLLPEADGGMRLLDTSCSLDVERDSDLIPAGHSLLLQLEEGSVHLDREARMELTGQAGQLNLQSFFPMKVKGQLVAVLAVALSDDEEEMNSEDRQLLATLAAQAASSFQGARLYEENLARIREVGQLKDYNESIVESSQVGILVLDRARRIRRWNRSMENLFRKRKQDVVQLPVAEVFPPEFLALLDGMPASGRRVERFPLPGPNENARMFNVALAEMRGTSGGTVVTFDEVTEQVRMEEQLLQSERLAAVGLLASGVAHEINTPLTGIASYAQMLLEECDDGDSSREYLERIYKQSWRASHIANSLLNFSRGSGDSFQRVDLNETVEETLALFGPQLKGQNIVIQFNRSARPPLVRGDQGRLQQVVLNLLLNARDAMTAGGELTIAATAENGCVLLDVADTGEGIPSENLSRLYDPFFTTKGAGKGTGLGLSVSYGIIKDHGGTLKVRSRLNKGTVFSVELPAWSENDEEKVSA